MLELLQESLHPVNLPFTLLLGLVALYWMIGLLGLVDLHGQGGEGAVIGEGDPVAADFSDSNGLEEGSANGGGSFLHVLMKIVGASDAPLIFILSLFSVLLWGMNVAGNHYFNPEFDGGRATLLLIPVLLGAFVCTRLLVVPLRPIMKVIRTPEQSVEIVGASGTVRSFRLDEDFGEVEVSVAGRTLILRARLSGGETELGKGAPILVVSKDEDPGPYVVRPLE